MTFAESTFALMQKKFKMMLQTIGDNLCEHFAGNTQQGNATKIVTLRLAALLVNWHNQLLGPVTGH